MTMGICQMCFREIEITPYFNGRLKEETYSDLLLPMPKHNDTINDIDSLYFSHKNLKP